MIRLVAWAACLVGCYDAPKPQCGFRCGPSAACPADYTCGADGRCHLDGSPAELACATPDAMPPDTYSPRVVFTNPVAGATMVDPATDIVVGFDVDVVNVSAGSFTATITSTTTPVVGSVSYSQTTRRATLSTQGGLPPNAELLVELTSDIFEPTTSRPLMPTSYTFRTGVDMTPPMVTTVMPLNGSTGAPVNTNVRFTFNEAVMNANAGTVDVLDGAVPVNGIVTYFSGGFVAQFDPQDQLLPNHAYTGRVMTGVTDLAGNPLAQMYTMSFTTGPDTIAPQIRTQSPEPFDMISVNSNFVVTFDEPVTNVTTATFQVNGGAVAGTVTMSNNNKTATFDPTSDLPAASTINVTLSTAITDSSANAFAGASYLFMTM